MAANSPAALPRMSHAAAGIGRWSVVLAASTAGMALAAAGARAGWPAGLAVVALGVHGGLAATGGWHLYIARASHRELLRQMSLPQPARLTPSANADVVHDLRAPIVTVRSYLELLIDESFGPLPAAARHAAEQAARASTRAQSLVESTLAAQSTGSPAAEAASRADLTAVLCDVVNSLAADVAATDARVSVGALPRVPGAEADYYRIFENLVENAIRYHRPGAAPHIVVEASEAAGAVEIAVSDDGIGIAPADRERIFQRHARGAGAGVGGHGLGLTTVRDLVTGLGGTVWIDPDVTAGTTVRLRLPR
jgi:signal transduction histidine kinase